MKRFFIVLCAVAAILGGGPQLIVPTPVAAEGAGNAELLQVDSALQQALHAKNESGATGLLDQDFTWTNETGQTIKSVEFLAGVAGGSVGPDSDYSELKARDYGQLGIVTGIAARRGHARTFFARIWVKRTGRWQLMAHQETPIVEKEKSTPNTARAEKTPSTSPDCNNPCRTVPFTPTSPGQQEIVKAYQAVETAVVSHDAKTWAYHVADEFVGIGRVYTGAPDTKAGRVGQIGDASSAVVLPRMIWGEARVFGDAAIMTAIHKPAGEPEYRVIRVWVNRDGRWQLFHRQETTIVPAPAPEKVA